MVKYWVDYLKGNYDFVEVMIVNNYIFLDVEEVVVFRVRFNWIVFLFLFVIKNYKFVV